MPRCEALRRAERRATARRLSARPWVWFAALALGLSTLTASALAHAEPDAAATLDITVSGQAPLLPSSGRAPTAASTVVLGERLHSAGASSADILQSVVGVQVRRTGTASAPATATIRGSDSWQTPIYLAGIRINDDVSGVADLSTVPLWMVQRVEVFRGNAPFTAERIGLSGAVFFSPRVPTETRVGASAGIGSYGAHEGWLMGETGKRGEASALVGVRHFRALNDYGFWNDHGRRFDRADTYERRINADVTDDEAWSIARIPTRLGQATLFMNAFDREQGVSGVATTQARSARAHQRRLLSGLATTSECRLSTSCSFETRTSIALENTNLSDPLWELRSLRSQQLHNAGQRLAQSATLALEPLTPWQLGINGGYIEEALQLDRMGNTPRRGRRFEANFGLDSRVQVSEAWLVYAMAQARCIDTRGDWVRFDAWTRHDERSCGGLPEARVGSSYALSDSLSLLSNLSRTVRLPTLGELYGTGPSVDGNPALTTEHSLNLDVGVRGQWSLGPGSIALDAFGFSRWSSDLVRYQRTSLNAFSPYNVGRARITGLESALATRWFGHWESETSLTLMDPKETTPSGRDTTPNDVLPLSSRMVLSQWLGFFSAWSAIGAQRVGVGARYFYTSSRYADPAGLVVLPEQSLWDAEFSVHWAKPELIARLAVDNLLDRRAQDLIGMPLPGRSFSAALEAWW